jgi:PAS domain S-box-containing protein
MSNTRSTNGGVQEGTGDAVPASGHIPADALLAALIDLSDDAVLVCDSDTRVSAFSDSAERLFGRHARDLVGEPIHVCFPAHLGDEMKRMLASVAAGERVRHFETEIVRPDGLPTPVSLSVSPLYDRAGDYAGSLMVARDVTEQHLAQATLAELDARLEEGEALAHVGSWLWDLRTDAVQWSAEFHRIHDVDPLEFAGTLQAYMDVIEPDDRDSMRSAMQESIRNSKPLDQEYGITSADGLHRVVRVRAEPTRGSDGNAVGLRGIGQDVTDLSP